MEKIAHYLAAATRDNTRRSYAAAIRHFEVEWGGFLPATADSMARYLVDHAETLSVNTLKQRLAALAQWHQQQGFPNPTKAPVVRQVLKGIRALHPAQQKQALPLQIRQLEQLVAWLDARMEQAAQQQDHAVRLRCRRDKALLLLGFWRGFRGDELLRLQIENIELVAGEGMNCFLAQSKSDRQLQGRVFRVPQLSRLCPVSAYGEWLADSGLHEGPVFRGISRWGVVGEHALHINSLIPLLRRLFASAGLAEAARFSGHSFRRGFANWASASGWDLKTLMAYVGWKDIQSAMRYIDAADPFARQRIENSLPSPQSLPPQAD
ncbi:site-specific integrase [Vogesella indigofera]|uniref:site-specific integrase n=1 Tax=Vogesella indigofera TaxID=45465 RepID=UPI00234E7A76|nr:site-specific integrase [Vogesella indigofera]MDC7706823.1 site-specific integrase [Vogesella indigofera]